MNNWIKPSELPPKFHGQCFVSYRHDFQSVIDDPWICMIQNYYRGTIPERWVEGEWSYLDDKGFRVMVIEYPKITEDDFKWETNSPAYAIVATFSVKRDKDISSDTKEAFVYNMQNVLLSLGR